VFNKTNTLLKSMAHQASLGLEFVTILLGQGKVSIIFYRMYLGGLH